MGAAGEIVNAAVIFEINNKQWSFVIFYNRVFDTAPALSLLYVFVEHSAETLVFGN